MMKAVCLISGGMDSSTLAYLAKSEGYDILAIHANYGQRTENKERACARKIAGLLGAQDVVEIDLRYFPQFGASSLTDLAITVDRFDPDRAHVPNTYVPFRNANLLSIATSFAEAKGAGAIFIGVQALDYSGTLTARGFYRCLQARDRTGYAGNLAHRTLHAVHPHDQDRYPEARKRTRRPLRAHVVLLPERGEGLRDLRLVPFPARGICRARDDRPDTVRGVNMEIFRTKRLWIEKSTVRFPNGVEVEKVTVHPGSAVAILPVTPTGYRSCASTRTRSTGIFTRRRPGRWKRGRTRKRPHTASS